MKPTIQRPFNAALRCIWIIMIAAVTLLALSCGKTDSARPATNASPESQPAPATKAATEAATSAGPEGTPASDAGSGFGTAQSAGGPTGSPAGGTAESPAGGTGGQGADASSPAAGGAASQPAPVPGTGNPGTGSPGTGNQRVLGQIVYSEGSVRIQRASSSGTAPERGDIGSVVRAFDVLVTGPKSRAEIDLDAGRPGGASIKLAENTAFYFDTEELDQARRKTVLQLLSGSLAIKVDKLANGSFRVGMEQAVLGVRGTVFIIDTVPDGSILVSCDSGAVEIREGGQTLTAKPGGVVELSDAGSLRLLAVQPENLADHRGTWRNAAYKSFSSRALSYTNAYAQALETGKPALEAALSKLASQETALAAWRTARAAGRSPRFTDWIPEKKAVSTALFDCLKALFVMERPYYRLLELKTLHAAGTGTGTLKDGRPSSAYFADFEARNAGIVVGMARIREALLLFTWASAGSPLGDFFGSKLESLGSGALFLEDD